MASSSYRRQGFSPTQRVRKIGSWCRRVTQSPRAYNLRPTLHKFLIYRLILMSTELPDFATLIHTYTHKYTQVINFKPLITSISRYYRDFEIKRSIQCVLFFSFILLLFIYLLYFFYFVQIK